MMTTAKAGGVVVVVIEVVVVVVVVGVIAGAIYSFSSLSYDRSKASSKASSPHSAI